MLAGSGVPLEVVSINSEGELANDFVELHAYSGDGRYAVFESFATNLVDDGGQGGVFLHDRQTNLTERVSLDSDDAPLPDDFFIGNPPAVSDDGRFVAFEYAGSDFSLLLRDRVLGTTTRIGFNDEGEPVDASLHGISGDGRFVLFSSDANYIVGEDFNFDTDLFVFDRQTGAYDLVSEATDGFAGDSFTPSGRISGDGRFVTFVSDAGNLVAGDTNGIQDVFLRDRQAGTTVRVSVFDDGGQVDTGDSLDHVYFEPGDVSDDGAIVAFQSLAEGLDPAFPDDAGLYVRDLTAGTTRLVSLSNFGTAAQTPTQVRLFSLSGDGRFVAFRAIPDADLSTGEVSEFGNGGLYLRDLALGVTLRPIRSADGQPVDGYVGLGLLSDDGTSMAFLSDATNWGSARPISPCRPSSRTSPVRQSSRTCGRTPFTWPGRRPPPRSRVFASLTPMTFRCLRP